LGAAFFVTRFALAATGFATVDSVGTVGSVGATTIVAPLADVIAAAVGFAEDWGARFGATGVLILVVVFLVIIVKCAAVELETMPWGKVGTPELVNRLCRHPPSFATAAKERRSMEWTMERRIERKQTSFPWVLRSFHRLVVWHAREVAGDFIFANELYVRFYPEMRIGAAAR
jgi:hypothetical protein